MLKSICGTGCSGHPRVDNHRKPVPLPEVKPVPPPKNPYRTGHLTTSCPFGGRNETP